MSWIQTHDGSLVNLDSFDEVGISADKKSLVARKHFGVSNTPSTVKELVLHPVGKTQKETDDMLTGILRSVEGFPLKPPAPLAPPVPPTSRFSSAAPLAQTPADNIDAIDKAATG